MREAKNLRAAGHGNVSAAFETALWLALVAALYVSSFSFEREIEIYKFGATAWPRVILLLIAIAAVGQLVSHLIAGKFPQRATSKTAADDAHDLNTDHTDNPRRYLWTFGLLLLPFAYMLTPQWLGTVSETLSEQHTVKLICAVIFIVPLAFGMRHQPVGAMLTLPIFFGALMQDFGFYSLAPFFALGVMYLMGERRVGWMAAITAILITLVLLLFVSLLYVGLPTGNISPFYDIGNAIVTLLQ